MLVIVIVTWNVRDLALRCLESLKHNAASRQPQHIVVVDNASSDGTPGAIRAAHPEAELLVNTVNRGFTGGNNDGLARARAHFPAGSDPKRDYVLLLNPDTEAHPGALDALLAYADDNPDIGILGPQLRYPDGSIQSSRRRFPTLASMLFENAWLSGVAPDGVIDRFTMRDRPDSEAGDVDWVVGAAMLARRSMIDQIGGLDEERFFMYSEETDWCKRAKDAGWRVAYQPAAVITHHEGASSGQVSARRMILFNTSKVRYLAKHGGAASALLLRLCLLALFAWQLGLEAFKWAIGHKRALRRERMRAYWGVLASGLG